MISAEDAAATLRAAAGAAPPNEAVKLLQRADAILADGPDATPDDEDVRARAVADWEAEYGKYDDPEVRARVAAAAAALARREREQADQAAGQQVAMEAKAAAAQAKRRRRGRRF